MKVYKNNNPRILTGLRKMAGQAIGHTGLHIFLIVYRRWMEGRPTTLRRLASLTDTGMHNCRQRIDGLVLLGLLKRVRGAYGIVVPAHRFDFEFTEPATCESQRQARREFQRSNGSRSRNGAA